MRIISIGHISASSGFPKELDMVVFEFSESHAPFGDGGRFIGRLSACAGSQEHSIRVSPGALAQPRAFENGAFFGPLCYVFVTRRRPEEKQRLCSLRILWDPGPQAACGNVPNCRLAFHKAGKLGQQLLGFNRSRPLF